MVSPADYDSPTRGRDGPKKGLFWDGSHGNIISKGAGFLTACFHSNGPCVCVCVCGYFKTLVEK